MAVPGPQAVFVTAPTWVSKEPGPWWYRVPPAGSVIALGWMSRSQVPGHPTSCSWVCNSEWLVDLGRVSVATNFPLIQVDITTGWV